MTDLEKGREETGNWRKSKMSLRKKQKFEQKYR